MRAPHIVKQPNGLYALWDTEGERFMDINLNEQDVRVLEMNRIMRQFDKDFRKRMDRVERFGTTGAKFNAHMSVWAMYVEDANEAGQDVLIEDDRVRIRPR